MDIATSAMRILPRGTMGCNAVPRRGHRLPMAALHRGVQAHLRGATRPFAQGHEQGLLPALLAGAHRVERAFGVVSELRSPSRAGGLRANLRTMSASLSGRSFRSIVIAALLAAVAACGGKTAADPDNREVPWAYGPRTSTSTTEHLQGSGHEGGAAIAKGWQCRLQGGKQLSIRPYQLATEHALFGKVVLSVSLFDTTGKELGSFVSSAITPQNASFTFEVSPDVAKQLWDLVIWYRKA